MKNFTMFVGLPGSGKSTEARRMLTDLNDDGYLMVLSSDEYRKDMYGDESEQGDSAEIFARLREDAIRFLQDGHDVVLDATNINRKKRVAFLESIGKYAGYKTCVLFATSVEICRENNQKRERSVPDYVIDRMWKTFNVPLYTEGWDKIKIIYNYDLTKHNVDMFLKRAMYFQQDNPHHNFTLGQHCLKVGEAMLRDDVPNHVQVASLLHDNGKEHTKVFTNKKGEPSDIAHYYGHENVGAYEYLFYADSLNWINHHDILFGAGLIEHHMRMYHVESDRARRKLIRTVGGDMFRYLELLNVADADSH